MSNAPRTQRLGCKGLGDGSEGNNTCTCLLDGDVVIAGGIVAFVRLYVIDKRLT